VADLKALRLQAWWHCREILSLHPGHKLAPQVQAEIGKGLYYQDVLLMGGYQQGMEGTLPDVSRSLDELQSQFQEGKLPEIPQSLKDTLERIAPATDDVREYADFCKQYEMAEKLHRSVENARKSSRDALPEIESLLDAELPNAHWDAAARSLSGILDHCIGTVLKASTGGTDADLDSALVEALTTKQIFDLAEQRAGGVKGVAGLRGKKRLNSDQFAEKVAELLLETRKESTTRVR
jgi:hypothetical protein